MKKWQFVKTLWLAAVLACVLARPACAAQIINNGTFETGLTGWSVANALGSDGSFGLQTGTTSPINGDMVPAPPGGTRAAMTDAAGPGTHILYQDFFVSAPVGSAVLTFDAFIGNRASSLFNPSPASLDFGAPDFNQQARVDILVSGATSFSVAATDVLLTAFQTNPGDPAISGYRTITANLTSVWNSHVNSTLRLRFAETDNVAAFQFGVDNVSLLTAAVPEPAGFLPVFGALLYLVRRRGKHE
jgi:hypothetical protein